MDINSKILKYIDGQLSSQDMQEFEVLINKDSDLKLRVEVLSDLINNAQPEDPPYELKEKIYNMLNIENESFMSIVIQKSSNLLNILSGKDYLISLEPAFITRSNNQSLLFSKDMDDYQIFCELYLDNNDYFLNLQSSHTDNKKTANIKFTFMKDSDIYLEKYTNSNGNTGSFEIHPGVYNIKITDKNLEIGNVKINIS